jgi:hypothetical protein
MPIGSQAIPSEDGNVKVALQSQTSPPFQYYLMREDKTDITLTSPASVDDTVVSVSAGHGFTAAGEHIVIMENNAYAQERVKAVSTNDITITSPLDNPFTTGATVIRGSIDMNVNGSVSPADFVFNLRQAEIPIDITKAIIVMRHATDGDDSKFGDLGELANGLNFRRNNGIIQGYGNYQSNGDFFEFGAGVEYTPKAGAGAFSTNITFNIESGFGVALRMNPKNPDIFTGIVNDNLTGLSRLHVSLLGQYTIGEIT